MKKQEKKEARTGEKTERGFEVVKEIHSVPLRKGEELRYSVIKVNGETRGDVRQFIEIKGDFRPTSSGVTFTPSVLPSVTEGFQKLSRALAA